MLHRVEQQLRGHAASHASRQGPFGRQKGIALILVLWVLALLGIIAATYSTGVRTETRIAHNTLESAKAHALLDAALNMAVMKLMERSGPDTDNASWRADGTVYEADYAGGKLRIAMVDEAGKIDLNEAPKALLDSLLQLAEVPDNQRPALLDAILDWRDKDHERRLNGAEDDDYAAAGLPYGAKDGPFSSVEELQLVLGMQPAWYQAMAPALTVYSGSGGINPVVAPQGVLEALPGIDSARVAEYVHLREEGGGELQPLSRSLLGNSPYLIVNVGRTFSLSLQAETDSGARARANAVIRLNQQGNSPFQVLVWKEPGRPSA